MFWAWFPWLLLFWRSCLSRLLVGCQTALDQVGSDAILEVVELGFPAQFAWRPLWSLWLRYQMIGEWIPAYPPKGLRAQLQPWVCSAPIPSTNSASARSASLAALEVHFLLESSQAAFFLFDAAFFTAIAADTAHWKYCSARLSPLRSASPNSIRYLGFQ